MTEDRENQYYLSSLFAIVNCLLLKMASSHHDLNLEEKMNLIKDKERGLTHRELSDKFKLSVGAISNVLKRKFEYTNDLM
jgi:hypothetical protein